MGTKFKELRQQLDCLGYMQKLVPECIPLVQRLLLDLNTTTENLQKYMRISQQALEERDLLELGAEPYKCDNGKLIKECNELHLAFIHFKERQEKIQRELRHQISVLQMQLENCGAEKNKLMSQIQQLEKEKFRRGSKANILKNQPSEREKNGSTNIAMTHNNETIIQLNKKLKDLEEKHSKVVEDNEAVRKQLRSRDEEIERLYSLIEGGRPYNAASKDCCYKNIDSQIVILQEEITRLKREKNDLQLQIKDALAKQHEAMRRALHLAERNRHLEKEMKDVDEIALAVEAECNNTVKENSEKVARLQDRINESLILIQNLERDNAKLKQTKLELSADLDAIKLEKIHMQKQLEKEQDDKKNLTDRINSFTIIENDLNLEIDRLTKLSTEQKRKIWQLESNIAADDGNAKLVTAGAMKTKHKGEQKGTCKKVGRSKSPSKSRSPSKLDSIYETDRTDFIQKCCCESGNCIKNLQNLLDKEIEYRQVSVKKSMEDLRQEKDYYMKEYHRVLEKMRNAPTYEVSENGITQLKQQLKDKEIQIKHLEDEVKRLNKDMSSLLVDEMQGLGVNKGVCKNASCKNKEKELEIKTGELNHLEIENNTLKAKLQAINETSVFNEERMKKAFKDMEEHIRKLEDERRDLVKADLTQRSNLSHLEEDYRNVRDELKQTQNELSNQRANYNQLKLLHEQTDRALSEAQAKVIYVETELANYKTKIRDSSRDTVAQDKEIAKLLSDIQFMKNQLTKLDREKDDLLNNLDEKTEKIALLEDELNAKNKLVSKLEDDLKELNRKLSKYANETSSQDQIVRAKQQEIVNLEQCYEKEKRLKEAALLENKRLQNDLSSVTCDCRDARNELEITMRQVEDLKRQLQHYVAEVKRTEDLISHKELERNELLDQFRCLSQEANILESNNHTLETEATQSKIQLSVALDHTSELERKVEHQESVIRSYEKQITDLTAHIAKLEVQLKQNSMDQEQYSTEMKQMRDLCVKLDKDKDNLKKELYSKEDRQSQVQQLTEKLNSEREALQKALEQERNSLEAVEKLLNEARRDVTEQRLLNQDLQHEVNRLKHQIEELERRLFHSCRKVEKQPTNVTEVPKSIVREDTVHFDNSLQDNSAAPTRMYGTTGKFNPEGPGKSLSRGTSLMSTKTLTMSNKFHGSDGMFHGAIDLTKLYQEESNNSLSTNNSNNDINGVSDSTFSMGMQEKPPSKIVSIISTKTLLPTKKFHGSDGLLHGVIDFTKLDQDNADCDEQCRKARCILHKNHTNAQQESKICHRYETNFDGCKKVEPKNELTKNQLNNAEVGPSYQTSENVSKFVEFSHLERLNNQPDVFTNENAKIRKGTPDEKYNKILYGAASETNEGANIASNFGKDDANRQKTRNIDNPKNTEAYSKFLQNREDSAVFHKVFSMDGVGLECHCCISSFKFANDFMQFK